MRFRICALLVVFLAVVFAPTAFGAMETVTDTVTLASGTTATTKVTMISEAEIKEVLVYVPELDAGTTITLSLTQTLTDAAGTTSTATVAIRGWTDKEVGATGDDAWVQCNSSVLECYVDGDVTMTFTCADAQAGARVFTVKYRVKFD